MTIEDRERFRQAVIDSIRQIPAGSVTSYGELARANGRPGRARLVGRIVSEWSGGSEGIPFHRVVGANGDLLGGWAFGHPAVMKQLLLDEDVPFRGEFRVDIEQCFWSPAPDEMDHLNDISIAKDGFGEL